MPTLFATERTHGTSADAKLPTKRLAGAIGGSSFANGRFNKIRSIRRIGTLMSTAETATAPATWPVVAQGVAVAGAAALAWYVSLNDGPWPLAIAGYLLGAVVSVFLLTLYRSISSLRRSKSFRRNPLLDRTAQLVALCGLVVGLYCGYLVATELAKW
ncbi:hypothetical protein [Georgenia muralis]